MTEVLLSSRFKGTGAYVVQDLLVRSLTQRYHRQRWVTRSGETVIAALPAAVKDHFGPELRRASSWASTTRARPRWRVWWPSSRDIGVAISKRQVMRLPNEDQARFTGEAGAVLRAGLETAAWVSVDDTGARHQARNGVCTQIGNDHFAWFATGFSKS